MIMYDTIPLFILPCDLNSMALVSHTYLMSMYAPPEGGEKQG